VVDVTTSPVTAADWVHGGPERRQLDDTSWVDVIRGWVRDPDVVFADLVRDVPWQQRSTWRYDHREPENRLSAMGRPTTHPALLAATKALRTGYGVDFDGPALCFYEHGGHAMGMHRDREMRWLAETVIGVLSLGLQRPFLLCPRGSRPGDLSKAIDLSPASGDLLVMGGRAQADWLHAVPPVVSRGGRISAQWRWTSRQGKPEQGAGYFAPRNYGR
jgi:alkylated DNA repair dioxygenase AlkB